MTFGYYPQAPPAGAGLLSGRRILLPSVRPAGADPLFPHGAGDQHGDGGVRRTGGAVDPGPPETGRGGMMEQPFFHTEDLSVGYETVTVLKKIFCQLIRDHTTVEYEQGLVKRSVLLLQHF